jgi:hypothetical protein
MSFVTKEVLTSITTSGGARIIEGSTTGSIILNGLAAEEKEEAEEESFSSDNDGSECLNYIPQEGSVHNVKEMELDLDFQGKGPKIQRDI